MRIGAPLMLVGLFTAGPAAAQSQDSATTLATMPIRFEAWRPAAMPADESGSYTFQPAGAARGSGRKALIGGAIGMVAGLATCTVISNIIKERGSGFSTCTAKGYFLLGGLGLVLGTVIGLSADEPET